MRFLSALVLLLVPAQVQARAAFAHFMVGNVKTGFTLADWRNEIVLAQQAHIDAFALNMAVGETGPLSDAFTAANSLGFKLFFSFDYAGNGLWDQGVVTSLINQYKDNGAYYKRNGAPLVSTFEGPQVAAQWTTIKQQTGCFFIPDWSSLGAKSAVALGVADGLFSWAAWPYGAADMTNTVDASYLDFLGGKPYMMPVSPWFFTNMPGFAGKNWLWRGDDLWHDRWQQVFALMPEFIQIISWNDYGESHYIGPLHEQSYEAFTRGLAPFNYARGMPHDGWRVMLPFLIDTYKNGIASVTQESVVAWYRLNSNTACASGGTTGNTLSQMQCELAPSAIAQDRIFYSAVLTSSASVTVTIGGTQQTGTWSDTPAGGVGIYHGSVPFNGATGNVVVTIAKTGLTLTMRGNAISATCANSVQNWNPWVGSAVGSVISPVSAKTNMANLKCIEGTGLGGKAGLCSFSCHYGYCPYSACTCTAFGDQVKEPTATGVIGYPVASVDASFIGLCSYACNRGYCPSAVCGTTKVTLSAPPEAGPFPVCYKPVCIAGEGTGNFAGLCSFSCNFGFCPSPCTCTAMGNQVPPPASTDLQGFYIGGEEDNGLCDFVCSHGYCPPTACFNSGTGMGGIFFDPILPDKAETSWCADVESSGDASRIWKFSQAGLALDHVVETTKQDTRGIDQKLYLLYTNVDVTNCASATDNSCGTPPNCPQDDIKKIPYHYIQKAFSNYHAVLRQMNDALVVSAIISMEDITHVVDDLAMELFVDTSNKDKIMAIIGGVFGVASSALGVARYPGFGAISGVLGGAMGLIAGVETKDVEAEYLKNVTGNLHERVVNSLTSMRAALQKTGEAVFDKGDFSGFQRMALDFDPTNQENWGYKSDMAKFFADGKYATRIKDFTPFQTALTTSMKEGLVSTVLLSARLYILRDSLPLADCIAGGGKRMDFEGEHCYTIERPGLGRYEGQPAATKEDMSQILKSDITYDILWLKRGVIMENIIYGSVTCQDKTGDYGGINDFGDIDPKYYAGETGWQYPSCFWNLPVMHVRPDSRGLNGATPCAIFNSGKSKADGGVVGVDYLPEHLVEVFDEWYCNYECPQVEC